MKVILSGQKSFGAATLKMLLNKKGVELAGVFAPVNDKLYKAAENLGLPLQASGNLLANRLPEDCDLLVAAHSHDFVSKAVRNRLNLGAIGYHPSLLPKHRGRDAIKWTIKMNDLMTGGTVFWLNETVDGGPIAAQSWRWVLPGDTASSLWERELFTMGIRLFSKVIDDILDGQLIMIEQDQELATWEPALSDVPRLYRPELLQIGTLPEGYRVLKNI